MNKPVTPAAAVAELRLVPLDDLDVAPENLRAGQPEDEAVGRLADTIAAAGLVSPLCVRPGRRKERPFMVLDGRRRLMALRRLQAEGRIAGDWPVRCEVFSSPTSQAAAVVLTGAERAAVHVADVIVAVGRLLKARMDIAGAAAALGYDEQEVRRLAALAGLHPTALEALRAGKITLRQARQLARLASREDQAEIAGQAMRGYLHEHHLTDRLERERVDVTDPRLSLVGRSAYLAAGGRLEADLFGELPEVLLDSDLLARLWRQRAEQIGSVLAQDGVSLFYAPVRSYRPPEGFEQLPYVHARLLSAEAQATWDAALTRRHDAGEALSALAVDDPAAEAAIREALLSELALARLAAADRRVGAAVLWPCATLGLGAGFYAEPAPVADEDVGAEAAADGSATGSGVDGPG